ncbi:MAG: hypothetical protein U5K54_03285 [Cytophagales bacterium]|nr:hypothetical protein [Cytophagales bacterium]
MRLKLTHRDLILLAGILVAVIITLTTLVLDFLPGMGEANQEPKSQISQPSPTVLIHRVGQNFTGCQPN